MKKYGFVFIFFIGLVSSVKGQSTLYMNSVEKEFSEGMMYYRQGLLGSARSAFENFLSKQNKTHQTKSVYIDQAEGYIALIALQTHSADAEKLTANVYTNIHDNSIRKMLAFHYAMFKFDNKQYKEAKEQFLKVNRSELTNEERVSYEFKLGYIYFIEKNFAQAKPLMRDLKGIEGPYKDDANYYFAYMEFSDRRYESALKSFLEIQDVPKYKESVPFYLAQIYFVRKEYDKVLNTGLSCAKDASCAFKTEMQNICGQSYYYKSQYAEAEDLLSKYLSSVKKTSKETLFQIAYSQYKNGKIDKAITNFKQLHVVEDSIAQMSFYYLGDCYLQKDLKMDARTAFAQAARLSFDPYIQEFALINQIKLEYQLMNFSEVVSLSDKYLKTYLQGKSKDEITDLLADALLRTKNYSEAIRIIESSPSRTMAMVRTYQKVCFYKGVQTYKDEKYIESSEFLDKSLKNPQDKELQAKSLFLKAEIDLKRKKYEESILGFGKYIQLSSYVPKTEVYFTQAKAYYAQGYSYWYQKNYAMAVQPFSRVLQFADAEESIITDAHLRLADCYYMTKSFENAQDQYQWIIDRNKPGSDYALMQKAMVQGFSNRESAKVQTLNTLSDKFPTSTYADQALFEKGVTLQQDLDDPNAAITAFDKLIKTFPQSRFRIASLMRLGLIFYNKSNEDKALSYYKQVVMEYPQSEECKDALGIIQDIFIGIGQPEQYVAYLNQSGISISASAQDSLYFKTAEEYYLRSQYDLALPALRNYIEKFPGGFYAYDARYFAADCELRSKNYSQALTYLDFIIEDKNAPLFEKSLRKAAITAFEQTKEYARAQKYFALLYDRLKARPEAYPMLMNVLRSSYLAKLDDEVVKYAELMLLQNDARPLDILEARYYRAQSLISKSKWSDAKPDLEAVASKGQGEEVAECNYYLSLTYYKNREFQKSLDDAFARKSKIEGYDYWLAKLFILIGDNYAELNDLFQAEATYQSIIDNYKGDEPIIEEAKMKKEEVRKRALENSLIKSSNIQDTIPLIQD